MKNRSTITRSGLCFLALCFLALPHRAQAVSPAPDGGYPGGNTAEGQNALLSLTIGTYNTAVGLFSLESNTDASFNTAIGAGALLANTAESNTATGAGALLSNMTGESNTANGAFALFSNIEGTANTATGINVLQHNIDGSNNTATGGGALFNNTGGGFNTADGDGALVANVTGSGNTAVGSGALSSVTTGNFNAALGENAGTNLTTSDSNNIDIGFDVEGVAGESNTIRIGNTDITDTFIRGISGATITSGAAVLVASNGHLGTLTSSKRFKDDIKPMDKASETLFSLKPVTFRYKREIDPTGTQQFGLVAEDVEKINPDLIVRDENGKVNSVRYEQVNAMLLNEFLKEHNTVQDLKLTVQKRDAIIAGQQKGFESKLLKQQEEIEALASRLQQVTAQLQPSKPQVVLNKR